MKVRLISLLSAVVVVLAATSVAKADTCDMTSAGASCSIGGAIFTNNNLQSTGTGVIDPFLRIQANGTEQGFNEDYGPGNNPLYDEKTGIWTHSEPLSNLIPTTINGTTYYQFLLDINQTSSDPYLTLTGLQLFQSSVANPTCTTSNAPGSCLGTQVFNLGANNVVMNYNLNPGSGAGDMWVYIPTADFSNTSGYLILYSSFGTDGCPSAISNPNGYSCSSNDGFEEWTAVAGSSPSVPEPGTLALFGTGALSLAGFLRRKLLA